MGGRVAKTKSEATKKGALALAAGVGTGVLFWQTSWIFGVAGLAGTIYLTGKWFVFRAKNGMRF